MNNLEAAGSNGDDRGSLRHAHARRPGCVGSLFTTFHRTNLAEHLGIRLRANFCSSLPPVRFLFNLLIVNQFFDRLSRI